MLVSKYIKMTVTPTITAGAYSDGDVVGGLLTLTPNQGVASGAAVLNRVYIRDKANQSPILRIHLYDAAPAVDDRIADNAAFARTDADLLLSVGRVDVPSAAWASVSTTNSAASVVDLGDVYFMPTGVLYAYIALNGSVPTFVSTSDLVLDFYWLEA